MLEGIDAGQPPEPERPRGVDPNATWTVPIGQILIRQRDEIAAARNELHVEQHGVLDMAGYEPEAVDVPLPCPECGVTEELALRGRWGEPATAICPRGHEWMPEPQAPEASVRWMQLAIRASVDQNGLP